MTNLEKAHKIFYFLYVTCIAKILADRGPAGDFAISGLQHAQKSAFFCWINSAVFQLREDM